MFMLDCMVLSLLHNRGSESEVTQPHVLRNSEDSGHQCQGHFQLLKTIKTKRDVKTSKETL